MKIISPSTFIACLALSLMSVQIKAEESVFSMIDDDIRKHIGADETFGYGLKIRSIARDEYRFWRGTRILFSAWSKDNCRDWYEDKSSYVISHGDMHPGNIGTYASIEAFGKVGFGLVDFDESSELPWQMDILQSLISIELIAYQNNIELSDSDRLKIISRIFDAYKTSKQSDKSILDLLHTSPLVQAAINESDEDTYKKELKKFTENGQFRERIFKKEVLTDILKPLDSARRKSFASGLRQAIAHDSRLKGWLGDLSENQIEAKILAIAKRYRVDSSGSQGLDKYLVLLQKPFKGIDHHIILYLKQVIPSASERSGAISPSEVPGAERLSKHMDQLLLPRPLVNSYCDIDGKSFWVTLKEPWSSELNSTDILSYPQIYDLCTIFGTVLGTSHRESKIDIKNLDQPDFRDRMLQLSQIYLDREKVLYRQFRDDPRVIECVTKINEQLEHMSKP